MPLTRDIRILTRITGTESTLKLPGGWGKGRMRGLSDSCITGVHHTDQWQRAHEDALNIISH